MYQTKKEDLQQSNQNTFALCNTTSFHLTNGTLPKCKTANTHPAKHFI
jgi:hypothetical protein